MANSGWTRTTTGFMPSEDGHKLLLANWSVQASVEGTGAVTADVSIQASNDLVGWVELTSFALSDTDFATNIATVQGGYLYMRAELEAVTGTGATVTVTTHQTRS